MSVTITSKPASPRRLDRASAPAAPRTSAAAPATTPVSAPPPAPRHGEFVTAPAPASPGPASSAATCSTAMAVHLLALTRPGLSGKTAEVTAAALNARGFERALLEAATTKAGSGPSGSGLPAGLVEHARTTWSLAQDIVGGRVNSAVERFSALPADVKQLVRQPLRELALEALRHNRYNFDEQVQLHAALSLPEAADGRLESFKARLSWLGSPAQSGSYDFSDDDVDQVLTGLAKLPQSERAAATGEVRAAVFDEAGKPKKSFHHWASMERLRTAVGFQTPAFVAPTAAERERARAEASKALTAMEAAREPSRREVVADAVLSAPLLLNASHRHPALGRLAALATLPLAVPVGAIAKGLSLVGPADGGSLVSVRELAPWLERAATSDGLELAAHASVARALLRESPRDLTVDAHAVLTALTDMGATLHGELQDLGRALVEELRSA